MGKKILLIIPGLLAVVVGVMAMMSDTNPTQQDFSAQETNVHNKPAVSAKDAVYTFQVNDFKMVRSTNRAERNNEKAYLLQNLLNDPKEISQFPLTQTLKQPFLDTKGKHIAPKDKTDIAPRVDLLHSKGAFKDFYKLKMDPTSDEKPSTVACVPGRGPAPTGNFKYKFTTKAEDTAYGTITYSCYVTPDNNKIKTLFETLPGTIDEKSGIKTMGQ